MTSRKILDYVAAEPFRPFRIRMPVVSLLKFVIRK